MNAVSSVDSSIRFRHSLSARSPILSPALITALCRSAASRSAVATFSRARFSRSFFDLRSPAARHRSLLRVEIEPSIAPAAAVPDHLHGDHAVVYDARELGQVSPLTKDSRGGPTLLLL